MSIATWEAEFYPTEAEKTRREDALTHSLRKWEGLKKENLDKHGLSIVHGAIAEEGYDKTKSPFTGDNPEHSLRMHSGNCALCHHYEYPGWDYSTVSKCKPCPLYQARGGRRCDVPRSDESESSWHHLTRFNDPMPMIAWLEKSKAFDPGEKERKEREAQEALERDVLPNIANYGHYQVTLNGGRRSWTKVDLALLAEYLPHGSGLNVSWHVTVAKNGKVTCRSTFSPMNSQGYYLADIEVGAEFVMGQHPHSDKLALGRVWARRDSSLRDYLYDLMSEARDRYNAAAKVEETKVPVGWDKV